ncbi:hypothetical protein B0T10DRAFT_463142 [Thelonectria olida]|uniref:Heterokaryon incompatibility domain-containing protein n=1 Tax=Thelonectria olida TaxID=1576542 RepID=A0A9P8VXZ8_9HYPO|nr:hypothetical protein B0T10DRAFT_463142 [Thelonectria olida]
MWSPIDSADENRRILSLTVSRHSLKELPLYYALSYTWGPPFLEDPKCTDANKVPVLLNGKILRVFPNLYGALLQLHQSYPVSHFRLTPFASTLAIQMLSSTTDYRVWSARTLKPLYASIDQGSTTECGFYKKSHWQGMLGCIGETPPCRGTI